MYIRKGKKRRILLWSIGLIVLLMNIVAALHAYRFTHFEPTTEKRVKPDALSFSQKLSAVLTGADNPRPQLFTTPQQSYVTLKIGGSHPTEGWYIKAPDSKGIVLICHGYGSSKAGMLDRAEAFLNEGYSTLLIDLMGAGAAKGNETTIGYKEAEQVAESVKLLEQMGAVSIMRYLSQTPGVPVQATILECPFGSLLQTVSARFSVMGVPAFPMAHLLVLWGGVENQFNAFEHCPIDYAAGIKCPVLLLSGGSDKYVSRSEIEAIYHNLRGRKVLKIYPLAGHENYLNRYKAEWIGDVHDFLTAEAGK
ncbi:alpha/beta hydrolase [Edaphocola aurantiacus]|uniref:alpha/beta hydrolase n=1 Tax=Edaphocola aurantiacus TaxID=2601682 RepID=UPI001C977FBB|nr:dienelactone hydrolase family protein [Edaphocola aurantiacus]